MTKDVLTHGRISAVLAFLCYFVGISRMIHDWPGPEYQGAISGWLYTSLDIISWMWFTSVPLAILAMASGIGTKELSVASSALWIIWTLPVIIDVLAHPFGTSILTLNQFVSYGLLFFGAPAFIMANLEKVMENKVS